MLKGARFRQSLGGTVGRQPGKKHYGRIWPNGNFSLGIGPVGEASLEMEEGDSENKARWGDNPGLAAAVAALTSSNGLKSHKDESEPARRGLKGITPLGQQMLRSACYLLERDYGNSDLCFATLTVPSLPPDGRRQLAENWSELVRQILQWVSRRLMSAGRPTKVAGCTEIQSARLERSGEGYLHLHLVFPSRSNAAGQVWAVRWDDLRNWWERALVRFSGCELPHHPRVETAPVRKSAERYMGKYLSKGSGEALEQFIADLGVESVPTAWWFLSGDLRSQVKAETARGPNTGALLDAVIQEVFKSGDFSCFEWIRHVEVSFTDRPVTVGWCGRLRPEVRDDLLSLLSPLLLT